MACGCGLSVARASLPIITLHMGADINHVHMAFFSYSMCIHTIQSYQSILRSLLRIQSPLSYIKASLDNRVLVLQVLY